MGLVSFARGVPAPECLAVEEIADSARAAIESDGAAVLSYGPGGGYAPLREWIAGRHGVEPGRVVVTNGSLQVFHFLLSVHPARPVIVDGPTYDRPSKILLAEGRELGGVPVDAGGLGAETVANSGA